MRRSGNCWPGVESEISNSSSVMSAVTFLPFVRIGQSQANLVKQITSIAQ